MPILDYALWGWLFVVMNNIFKIFFIVQLLIGCGDTENKSDLPDSLHENKTHFPDSVPKNKSVLPDSASEKERIESAVELRNLKETKVTTYIDPSTNKPFSGWAKMTWDNGQVVRLYKITDGEVTRFKKWQQNGIPQFDIGFTKGNFVTATTYPKIMVLKTDLPSFFTRMGKKSLKKNYKDGKRDRPQNFGTRTARNGVKQVSRTVSGTGF